MSASSRLRFAVAAAACCCFLIGYATAEPNVALDGTSSDTNASGQSDRANEQQAEPSAAPVGVQSIGETNPNQTNYRASQTAANSRNSVVDRFLAACLLAQNNGEIELSKIALQKSENPEVKEFAEKLIQDHQKMVEQLQPLAAVYGPNHRASSILGGTSEAQGRSETTEGRSSDTTALPGSAGATQTLAPSGTSAAVPPVDATTEAATGTNRIVVAAGGPIHELMQIDRQINERCLEMAREEMHQKSGAEFDKCYIGTAIAAHAHALAALEVISKQTQGTLAQVAQQAQPTVQQHLVHAKQLMKQLDNESGATHSQAQRETSRPGR